MRTPYVSLELSKRGPLNRLNLSISICNLSILRMFARILLKSSKDKAEGTRIQGSM